MCAGGNDLDEGIHHGTRTVRRRRHCAHPPKLRRETRLVTPGSTFGPDWRVLLSQLVLFGYIYPGERDKIPTAIMDDLIARLQSEKRAAEANLVCNGTLLSRKQYLLDVQQRGFRDARLQTRVNMNARDIAHWTRAIAKKEGARRMQ